MAIDNPSEADLAMCALADLGRDRQEELPLDHRERKGPRYAPTRRNGTDHIPKKIKLDLKKAWGNPIRDEESQQMEGLAMGDCPWRQGRERRPQITRLPEPLPPPAPRCPNMPDQSVLMRDNTAAIGGRATVQTFTGTGPPRPLTNSSVVFNNSRSQSASVQNAAPQQGMVGNTSQHVFEQALNECDMVINVPEEGEISPTWTFYWGSCIVYPNANPERWFVARFEMQMSLCSMEHGPTGNLRLAAHGLPTRVHPLDKLNQPLLEGRFCIISTTGPMPEASYRLELKDQATTELFAGCLQGLQNTVVHLESKASTNGQKDAPSSATSIASKPQPNPASREEKLSVNGGDPTSLNGLELSLTVNDSAVSESLVDIDETQSTQPAPKTDIQNAIEDTLGLVDRIAEALVDTGPFPNPFDSVEKTVENFLTIKYPSLESMDRVKVNDALKGIISTIVYIKQLTRSVDASATFSTSSSKLEVPESVKEFLKPITYSPETLQKFRPRAVLPDGALGSSSTVNENSWQSEIWKNNVTPASSNSVASAAALSASYQNRKKQGLGSSMFAS